jgi:uncharacterized protein (DUF58 family)
VVFLVSDFLDTNFEKALRVSAKRHDVIAISVTDPLEASIPNAGLVEFEDPETGRTVLVDTSKKEFRTKFAADAAARRKAVSVLLASAGVDEIAVSTDKGYVEPLIRFFKKREKIIRR